MTLYSFSLESDRAATADVNLVDVFEMSRDNIFIFVYFLDFIEDECDPY